jgi:long-chain fatty acid transport protein
VHRSKLDALRVWGGWLACAVLLAAATAGPAAAGGLYPYEVGTDDVGLASAGWAARAQNPGTVFTNPAGMTRLEGVQIAAAVQPTYVGADFTTNSDTTVTTGSSGDGSVWLPAMGLFASFAVTENLRLGFGLLNYFGGATDFGDDWKGRYYVQEQTLLAPTLQPAIAYRITDWLSVGGGVLLQYGYLKYDVAINNVLPGFSDGQLELKDGVFGIGGNVGILIEPCAGTRFGIQYLTPVSLDFEDEPSFSGLAPGINAILTNRGLIGGRLDLGLEEPMALMVSAYHDLTQHWAIMGNAGWQDWSSFGKVDVGLVSTTATSLTVEVPYKDTWHVGAGTQYRYLDWLLSFGFAYDSSMVSDSDRTLTLPIGAQYRFAGGLRYAWSERLNLGVAYEMVWQGDLPVDQNRGALAGRVAGDFRGSSIQAVSLNLDYRF